MTRSQPPEPVTPPGRRDLAASLIELAGTADDDSTLNTRLVTITQLTADQLDAVAFASVTRHEESGYSTVAVSSELARAVDEAQYADNAGPCLDALDGGSPTSVPVIDSTMIWPRFRDVAYRLGLRSSLSIPLFAGRGLPVAALNLYGHDPTAMAPLSAAVLATYDDAPEGRAPGPREGPVPGRPRAHRRPGRRLRHPGDHPAGDRHDHRGPPDQRRPRVRATALRGGLDDDVPDRGGHVRRGGALTTAATRSVRWPDARPFR